MKVLIVQLAEIGVEICWLALIVIILIIFQSGVQFKGMFWIIWFSWLTKSL